MKYDVALPGTEFNSRHGSWRMHFNYFITSVADPAHVKIGTSIYLPARLHDLQHPCPTELRLLTWMPGFDEFGEADLHYLFAPLWKRGEIFEFTEAMREFIARWSFILPHVGSVRKQMQPWEFYKSGRKDNLIHSVLESSIDLVQQAHPMSHDERMLIIRAKKGKVK